MKKEKRGMSWRESLVLNLRSHVLCTVHRNIQLPGVMHPNVIPSAQLMMGPLILDVCLY
jgi:hypothetical protein